MQPLKTVSYFFDSKSWAVCSLFNPIGNNNTKDVERELNSDELSTGCVLGSLGGPNRNDSVKHSCTPSIDETSADHPSVILSRSLESSSNNSPTSSETYGLDAAITVTEPTTDETAYESTEIVDGDDTALEEGVIDDWRATHGIWMTEFHGCIIIVNCTVDTTHHALIITEEEDGETSDTVDGYEKAALLKLVDHIGSGNDIHGGD